MKRRAFTVLELLVVVGILVLLVGLTFGVMSSARKQSAKTMTASLIASIRTAMDAYIADHAILPIPLPVDAIGTAADRPNPPTGAQLLAQMLIAPAPAGEDNAPAGLRPKADGLNGPGFKLRPAVKVGTEWVAQGRVYGPYMPAEKVRLSNPTEPLLSEILDTWGTPIDYVPHKLANVSNGVGVNAYAKNKYSLVSAGPDMKFGTGDDIRNDP